MSRYGNVIARNQSEAACCRFVDDETPVQLGPGEAAMQGGSARERTAFAQMLLDEWAVPMKV